MRISNIQTYKPTYTQVFQAQRNRHSVHNQRTDYRTGTYFEEYNGYLSKKENSSSNLKKKIAAIAAATAIAGSGVGGFVIGKNQRADDAYVEAYNKGWQDAYVQFENSRNMEDIFMPAQTVLPAPNVLTNKEGSSTTQIILPTPNKVLTIAGGDVTEFDLSQKAFSYRDDIQLPEYFTKNNIDENVLKTAQANMARVFERNGYVIISPVQTTTMGELKRVFGILDGVIAKEPKNELSTRPQTEGSNGNYDNAIIEPFDAIILKKYDQQMGHQVGFYTAHKSNKSLQKIADEIIKWANK